MDTAWFGIIASWLGIVGVLVKASIDHGKLLEKVENLSRELSKHEPVLVGVAELAVEVRNLKDVIADLKGEIHNLRGTKARTS